MREKRLNRQPSGPGRSTKRTRTPKAGAAGAAAASGARQAAAAVPAALKRAASRIRRRPRGRLTITRRAVVLIAVVAVLGLSFVGSLRVWMVQSADLAAANAQIEQYGQRVSDLEDELHRWDDPSYVSAQARARLGWVMPGEVGYRVIDADGRVLSGTTEIEGVGAAHNNGLEARWWDRLTSSLRHADQPDPANR